MQESKPNTLCLGTSLADAKSQVEDPCYSATCVNEKAQANLEVMAGAKTNPKPEAKAKAHHGAEPIRQLCDPVCDQLIQQPNS